MDNASDREVRSIGCNDVLVGCLILLGYSGFVVFQSCSGLVLKVELQNSLKGLLIALHEYHDEHGHFPPAKFVDDEGNVHSWRSLMVAESSGYLHGEPWDSPGNRNAGCGWQHTFDGSGYSCLAIVGDSTVWPRDGYSSINEITDGTSSTIIVLLIKDAGIGWWEPRDLVFDGQQLVIQGDPNRPISLEGGLYGLADGSFGWISEAVLENLAAFVEKDDRTVIENW